MFYKVSLSLSLLALTAFLITGCQDHQNPAPPTPALTSTTLATGLKGLIGVETDSQGRVWITESGTGQNDGRVSMVGPNGTIYPAITGFDSEIFQGEPNGLNHLLFADGWLYILGSHSRLYKANVSGFQPGSAPVLASSLALEDKKQFLLDYKFTNDPSRFLKDTEDTHLYNMILGPDGALYFTDAGTNAIIRRSKTGDWSVVAEVPGIPSPLAPLPAFVESVPTGITFNGKDFIITTLLGFPFPANSALIYKMTTSGVLTTFPMKFTSLVDVENDGNGGMLVLQHGVFGPMGFMENTGKLIRTNGTTSTDLITGLNKATDLKVVDNHTAYLTTLEDGTSGILRKITF